MPQRPIVFCAFETSGDALAACVIAALRVQEPQRPIFALGGPRMKEAGAELLEETTHRAVMFTGALSQALEHRRRVKRLASWLSEHPVAVLVAVDSPAANWSVCQLVRRMQPAARIVHLVAPQLWAWAPWRIGKLRRLTDRVLCVLPFEPAYFQSRNVPAVFVGHPLFDPASKAAGDSGAAAARGPDELPADLSRGRHPKLALLPGSRASEIRANFPTMLQVVRQLRHHHPHLEAIVAASSDANATLIRSLIPNLTRTTQVLTHRVDDVLGWCDVALVVSGTATLHVAAHRKPMVVLFNVKRLAWLAARWLIQTRTFSLPNLIGESLGLGRIVPELVPHFGEAAPVERAVDRLLRDEKARKKQVESLACLAAAFRAVRFSEAAVREIVDVIASPGPAVAAQ